MSELELYKMTPIIKFERQLLPQPPKDSEPWFCYTNTLIFYEKGTHKEVWRELIPEADQLEPFQVQQDGPNILDARHGQHNIRVEYHERWGWILKFTIAHENAKAIWKVLFPGVNFDRGLYQKSEGKV